MKKYKIDVNIVDDHTMLTEGLSQAINKSENAHVSHTFKTLESCRQALKTRRPDVLLLDISMPDGDGIKFCQQVVAEYPQVRVLAMTCHDEYSLIQRMLNSGAHGYILKSSPVTELLNAISLVYQGENYISEEVDRIIQQGAAQQVPLTGTELDILRLICAGHTNPEIAEQLYLSTETVNWHRKRLLAKFRVKNTVGLVSLAIQEKLL